MIELLDGWLKARLGVGPFVQDDEGGDEVAVCPRPLRQLRHRFSDRMDQCPVDEPADGGLGVAVEDRHGRAVEVEVLRDERGQEDALRSVADRPSEMAVHFDDPGGRRALERLASEALQSAVNEVRMLDQDLSDLNLGVAVAAPGTGHAGFVDPTDDSYLGVDVGEVIMMRSPSAKVV